MNNSSLHPKLEKYIKESILLFDSIPNGRKELLQLIAKYINKKLADKKRIDLMFICTHNSRRSHISQLWAQAAAYYFNIPNTFCYSAGTEATAFNPRAVKAMVEAGFQVETPDSGNNPNYRITFGPEYPSIDAFSKTIEDKHNPKDDFAAIMTCNNADEACPVVSGADARFPVKYEDPKVADNTPQEESKYKERCRHISIEMLFLFSAVNSKAK